MPEDSGRIERPAVYRTLLVAFTIWAAHFAVSYGAALVFPQRPAARWIAIAALFCGLAGLALWTRRLGPASPKLARAAIALAAAGIIFGTLPAVIG